VTSFCRYHKYVPLDEDGVCSSCKFETLERHPELRREILRGERWQKAHKVFLLTCSLLVLAAYGVLTCYREWKIWSR